MQSDDVRRSQTRFVFYTVTQLSGGPNATVRQSVTTVVVTADSALCPAAPMAGPSAVLPSIFSLCDLAALDDDPSWGGALEGTLTGSVSYLGLDTIFTADLDPLSGAGRASRLSRF